MSVDNSAGSSTTGDAGSGESGELKIKYSAEELTRKLTETSSEAKKHRLKAEALQAQLEELQSKVSKAEEDKLQEQGRFKDMYEQAKKQLEESNKKLKEKDSKYAYTVVTSRIASEAAQAGCKRTDDLIALMSTKGWMNDLEVDENFNVSADSVKSVLEKAQKEMDYLFGKPAPNLKDGVPASTIGKAKSLKEMSLSEKLELYKQAK